MTIDNAISDFEKMMKHQEDTAAYNIRHGGTEYAKMAKANKKKASEYRQIAEWLKELKKLKEQAEPCEDCISRQALLDAIYQKEYGQDYNENLNVFNLRYVDIIKALPSVKPIAKNATTTEDCVSRQDVLNTLYREWHAWECADDSIQEAMDYIREKLPSVTLQPTCNQVATELQPCEDCVSRQATIDAFGLSEKTRKYGGDRSGYDTMMLYEIQDVLEGLPSVKPIRPRGRWIGEGDGYYDGELIIDMWSCSECGKYFDEWDEKPTWKYCPKCGAEMEVDDANS